MEEHKKGINPKLIVDKREVEYRRQQEQEEKEAVEKFQQSSENRTIDLSRKREKLKKAFEKFKDSNLMININKELSKEHLENDKEKLLTFVIMCSSSLPPKDRVSGKIRGGTAEGKTNLVNVCKRHLPSKWYINATRITQASLEDDVKDINLIIILEKPTDKYINDALKQASEDGMEIWKKDKETNKQTHKGYIPRKSVIDTSTSEETDEEVANRALIIHIKGDKKRFQKVVDTYTKSQSRLKIMADRLEELEKESWIKLSLPQLDIFYDIVIPGFEAIPIDASEGRIQRDVKRFCGLVKTIAWLHQKNRRQLIANGKKYLIAQVEDICWAQYLSSEAFVYSITGLSPKIEDMLKTIDKLISNGEIYEVRGDQKPYVLRQRVQEKLSIKAEKTIRERVKEAENIGVVKTYQEHEFAPAYVRRTGQLKVRPLIGYKWAIIFKILKPLQGMLFNKQFIADLYQDYSENYSEVNTYLPDNNKNSNNLAINLNKEPPSEIENYTYEQLIDYINKKFIAENYSCPEPKIGPPIRRILPKPV